MHPEPCQHLLQLLCTLATPMTPLSNDAGWLAISLFKQAVQYWTSAFLRAAGHPQLYYGVTTIKRCSTAAFWLQAFVWS